MVSLSLQAQEQKESIDDQISAAQELGHISKLIELGNGLIHSDQEKALEVGLKAAQMAKRQSDPLLQGDAALLMGRASLAALQTPNAIRYFYSALGHYEKGNHEALQLQTLLGIAQAHGQDHTHEPAIKRLNEALQIAIRLNDKASQLEIYRMLGDHSMELGNLTLAYDQFEKLLHLLEEINDNSTQHQLLKAYTLSQMGAIFQHTGNYNQSISSFRKVLNIHQRIADKALEAEDKANLAYTFYLMHNPDSALTYYKQAIEWYRLQNDSLSTINILLGIGDVYYSIGQFRQAADYYHRSLQQATTLNLVKQQVISLVNISRCYSAFNDFPSSQSYLIKALELTKQGDLTGSAAEVYMYLSYLNENEGKYAQALDYYKLWAELRDSIYSEESGQKLARMQILYEISQKERENEILRQNNEIGQLQLAKTRYHRLVFIVLAISLFILLLLFAFFYRMKRMEFKKQSDTEQRITEINKNLERRLISEMKKQEKQQQLLAQKSKLESLGTLAAGIAHEINQPLGGISMGLENVLLKLSQNTLSDEYLKEKLSLTFDNIDRIHKIIDQTRKFSRAHKQISFERVDINEIINSALLMLSAQFKNHQINLNLELSKEIDSVIADRLKLEQIVLNLLSNAKHAVEEKWNTMDDPTSYEKTVTLSTWQDEEFAYISVHDNGQGIKQKDLEKVFDPFFTTKKQDKGTGLGLSIAYGFLKDIQGDISVDSQEGVFTKFEIKIPKS